MGLIPVLQLCFLAYYSHLLHENGVRPIEVMSRPPMSILVLHPAIAIVVGICLAVWVLTLAFRKSGGIGHVSICQVVLAQPCPSSDSGGSPHFRTRNLTFDDSFAK